MCFLLQIRDFWTSLPTGQYIKLFPEKFVFTENNTETNSERTKDEL